MAKNDKAIRDAILAGDFDKAKALAEEVGTRSGGVFDTVRAMLNGGAPAAYSAPIAYAIASTGKSADATGKAADLAKYAKAAGKSAESAKAVAEEAAATWREIRAAVIAAKSADDADKAIRAAAEFGGGFYYGADGFGAVTRFAMNTKTVADVKATAAKREAAAAARKAAAEKAKRAAKRSGK